MKPDPHDNGPFSLARVLEEEYAALHGPLPAAGNASLAEKDRLAAIHTLIHNLSRTRTALCLSGGGIRSATFGLGVLQGLARLSLLKQYDYLSTVSGGGYIGSWLTAWIHRHPKGMMGVTNELRRPSSDIQDSEPNPLKWLRQYSNYLSPRLGLMSVDSWTLIGTYLRNLTLNWMVLVPLLAAVLMAPRLLVSLVRWNLPDLGLPPSLAGSALIAGLLMGTLALAFLHTYRPSLESYRTQHIWKRFERQQWFLIAGLAPLLLATFSLSTAYAWHRNAGGPLDQLALDGFGSRETFVLGGAVIHGAGWLLSVLLLRRWRTMNRWLGYELLVILWSGALGGLLFWSVLAKIPATIPVADFAEWYACFAVPGFLAMFLITATIFVGVASRYTDDHDREWWGRAGAWTLIVGTTWGTIGALIVFGPGLISFKPTLVSSVGGLSGLISLVLGFSAKTSATAKGKQSLADLVIDRAVRLAAPVFIACLLVLLALLTGVLLKGLANVQGLPVVESLGTGLRMPPDVWGHAIMLHNSPPWLLVETAISFVTLAVAMSLVININKFSLHSIYRNRLIRAYLSASRLPDYGEERRPNLFTGFDPNDNVPLHQLAQPDQPVKKPFHVLNIALNLVRSQNLAWQQRKATSFTASPLFCGSWNLGYRLSSEYGSSQGVGKSISLGTAMAVSGAAASPNMGYHSTPAVTFLLAFFNVRLGWWLGNPGPDGANTFNQSCPRIAVRPLLAETFGLTDANSPYVYLYDGGHFENLGLYEMVLRRCHCIVVSDASCDSARSFTDLGNAIRKIRIDQGIDIDINPELLRGEAGGRLSRAHYALGIIRYDRVDHGAPPGLLIYLKPSLTGDEPADVTEYADCHDEFPHEPTADQFFDESQFESYRSLGAHVVEEVFGSSLTNPTSEVDHMFEQVRASWSA